MLRSECSELSEDSNSDVYVSDESYESDQNCMYGNEPEYTAEELNNMILSDTSNHSESEEEGSDLDSSRLENLHSCTCTNCTIMPTLPESKCCKEFSQLLKEKLDSFNCITENQHFTDICLQKHILETAYIQNRRYNNKFADIKTVGNK